MNPTNFFGELRRRNVYRVAVAYGIVAWLITQVATQTFPFLEIPNWCVRLVIVLLVFGFPVAMILAWAYELTPEGIKRTEEIAPTQPARRPVTQRLNVTIIAVLTCAVAFLIYQRYHSGPASNGIPEKSIAVLPFDNFSDDKENAFFADGIQDDILTSLAKIHDLKVISRTSVMVYRGAAKNNLPQIAQALGVVNVLEGSVRRGGNRVVVSVQLIDARNDRQLWAKRYDRQLADSLGLQGELASEIATELRASLSPEEKGRVVTKPTENPDAYVLYLKARAYEANPDRLFEDFKLAERLYSEALQHDPSFALAHARLSATLARIYHWFDPTDDANVASEIAFTYAFIHDWPQAAQRYDRVVALAPESANFKINRAYIDLYANGKTDALKSVLAEIPAGVDPSGLVTRARWDLAMLERDYAGADQAMSSYALDVFQCDGMPMPKSFFRACTALARGDAAAAQTQFAAALPTFELAAKQAPTGSLRHANLGLLYSFMGRKEDAIREGRRAVELEPETRDAVNPQWMK